MALFYQINFTAERQRGGRIKLCVVLVLVACVAAAAGNCAWRLFEDSRRPVLQPRLAQYQTLADRVSEALAAWKKASAAYQEVRPYVEKGDQAPLLDMLASLECVARMKERVSPNGIPYRFLPIELTISREKGLVTLKGVAPLPTRDKSDHLKELTVLISNAFASGGSATNVTCQLTWKKEVPAAEDMESEATLKVTFGALPSRAYPAPPPELESLVQSIGTWRDAVHRCVVINGAGSQEKRTVDQMLLLLVSSNRQALGAAYERVKALAIAAVDPMVVTAEIVREADTKSPVGLAAFEQSWLELSLRRWRREATLDKPELDRAVSELGRFFSALPRKQDFESSLLKSESYFNALTNGVQRQHIAQEDTFWTDMLKPCFSNMNATLPVRLKSTIMIEEATGQGLLARGKGGKVPASSQHAGISSGQRERVAFPVWRVAIGQERDTSSRKMQCFLLEEFKTGLMNIEAHSTGSWVTSLSITFNAELSEPQQRWKNIQQAQIEGRVPCWLGNEAKGPIH